MLKVRPKKGDVVSFPSSKSSPKGLRGTITETVDAIAWFRPEGGGGPSCFIWRFAEGLNAYASIDPCSHTRDMDGRCHLCGAEVES